LRVGVVGRPPWTFLCVLLLAPLGSTVLEPHLLSDAEEKKTKPLIISEPASAISEKSIGLALPGLCYKAI
jgi:hypothetical protein